MTQHDLTARAHHWATATIAGVALLAVLAHTQRRDEVDEQAARVHAEQQAKAAAQPDTWAGLDRAAKK